LSAHTFTRPAFLAALASLAALAAAPAAQAAPNADAERYVQEHASNALRTLGDRGLAATRRQQTFYQLMERFSDMPRIALWVVGRYGDGLRNDAALRAEWTQAFQDYAIATYEYRLSNFSGSVLRVTGSNQLGPGRVEVACELVPNGETRPIVLRWLINQAGADWRVFDIQVRAENGDSIWLGQRQRAEFLAMLDSNGGDVRALARNLRTVTASMRQRMLARG
jgi:phospholipid transport system substrate-binding protein